MKEKQNSYILVFYLLIGLFYYLGNTPIRALLFGIVLALSFYLAFVYKNQKTLLDRKKILVKSVFLLVGVLLIQLFNDTIVPFVFYIVSAPVMALFIMQNRFDTKIIKRPIYIMSVIFLGYFLMKRNLAGLFYQMSVNYISVVMIMNVVLVNMIERIQKEKISILPAVLALFFSLLAMGRSGILCSLLLVLNALYFSWKDHSHKKKLAISFFVLIPFFLIILLKSDLILDYLFNLSVLERFEERGVDSPSRDILKREYLAHLDLRNLLMGYNFTENQWFIHYGLNPHNSYMRLHFYFGLFWFPVIYFILKQTIRLFCYDKFFVVMVGVILLRSWTDSTIFLTIYDFVLLYLLLIPICYTKNKNNAVRE